MDLEGTGSGLIEVELGGIFPEVFRKTTKSLN
jgi:hypothetical protein